MAEDDDKFSFRNISIPFIIANLLFQTLANMIISNNEFFIGLPNPLSFFSWNYEFNLALSLIGGVWSVYILGYVINLYPLEQFIQFSITWFLLIISPLSAFVDYIYYQINVAYYSFTILPFPFNSLYIISISTLLLMSAITSIQIMSSRFGK